MWANVSFDTLSVSHVNVHSLNPVLLLTLLSCRCASTSLCWSIVTAITTVLARAFCMECHVQYVSNLVRVRYSYVCRADPILAEHRKRKMLKNFEDWFMYETYYFCENGTPGIMGETTLEFIRKPTKDMVPRPEATWKRNFLATFRLTRPLCFAFY